jgi:hypothetical protein
LPLRRPMIPPAHPPARTPSQTERARGSGVGHGAAEAPRGERQPWGGGAGEARTYFRSTCRCAASSQSRPGRRHCRVLSSTSSCRGTATPHSRYAARGMLAIARCCPCRMDAPRTRHTVAVGVRRSGWRTGCGPTGRQPHHSTHAVPERVLLSPARALPAAAAHRRKACMRAPTGAPSGVPRVSYRPRIGRV